MAFIKLLCCDRQVKIKSTGVSISALPIPRLSRYPYKRGSRYLYVRITRPPALYGCRDSLDIGITGVSISVQGLDIRTSTCTNCTLSKSREVSVTVLVRIPRPQCRKLETYLLFVVTFNVTFRVLIHMYVLCQIDSVP